MPTAKAALCCSFKPHWLLYQLSNSGLCDGAPSPQTARTVYLLFKVVNWKHSLSKK